MADPTDYADAVIEDTLQQGLAKARQPIPEGNPGHCDYCEEWFPRLVNDACGRCRDFYRLG